MIRPFFGQLNYYFWQFLGNGLFSRFWLQNSKMTKYSQNWKNFDKNRQHINLKHRISSCKISSNREKLIFHRTEKIHGSGKYLCDKRNICRLPGVCLIFSKPKRSKNYGIKNIIPDIQKFNSIYKKIAVSKKTGLTRRTNSSRTAVSFEPSALYIVKRRVEEKLKFMTSLTKDIMFRKIVYFEALFVGSTPSGLQSAEIYSKTADVMTKFIASVRKWPSLFTRTVKCESKQENHILK